MSAHHTQHHLLAMRNYTSVSCRTLVMRYLHCFYEYSDADSSSSIKYCFGDLLRESFLHLQSSRIHVRNARKLAQTQNLCFRSRDVCNVDLQYHVKNKKHYSRDQEGHKKECQMKIIHTFPVKGIMWCSQSEWISISFTITILDLAPSEKIP